MVKLISYGIKNGELLLEQEPDHDFDVTTLPNPFYQSNLRLKTGKDAEVQAFLTDRFLNYNYREIMDGIDRFLEDGVTIAFHCYGGRHRSVAIVEIVATRLREYGMECEVEHRDLKDE